MELRKSTKLISVPSENINVAVFSELAVGQLGLLIEPLDCSDGKAVRHRNSITVQGIVQRVLPVGSIVMSDQFRSYNQLQTLGYHHFTVNHHLGHIVRYQQDAILGHLAIHTQTIDGFWGNMKTQWRSHRRENGGEA